MPTQRLKQKRVEECVGWGRGGSEREKERAHACTQERKSEKALWLLLLYVFSFTWACPMQIGLSQECCLFYPKSSLWSSDLPWTFLCSIFGGFSLPCLLATTILDSFSYSTYLTVKNLPTNAGNMGSIPGTRRFHMPRGN